MKLPYCQRLLRDTFAGMARTLFKRQYAAVIVYIYVYINITYTKRGGLKYPWCSRPIFSKSHYIPFKIFDFILKEHVEHLCFTTLWCFFFNLYIYVYIYITPSE